MAVCCLACPVYLLPYFTFDFIFSRQFHLYDISYGDLGFSRTEYLYCGHQDRWIGTNVSEEPCTSLGEAVGYPRLWYLPTKLYSVTFLRAIILIR
jgi:hypothetical protein